jgi:hypothetical protein
MTPFLGAFFYVGQALPPANPKCSLAQLYVGQALPPANPKCSLAQLFRNKHPESNA